MDHPEVDLSISKERTPNACIRSNKLSIDMAYYLVKYIFQKILSHYYVTKISYSNMKELSVAKIVNNERW